MESGHNVFLNTFSICIETIKNKKDFHLWNELAKIGLGLELKPIQIIEKIF